MQVGSNAGRGLADFAGANYADALIRIFFYGILLGFDYIRLSQVSVARDNLFFGVIRSSPLHLICKVAKQL
jgi:hypothetical protein